MTNIINILPDEEQEVYVRNYISELDSITNNKPYEVIAQLNATNRLLINVENRIRQRKHQYEQEFIERCNSEEYLQEYKTIKQREQMATLERDNLQRIINKLKHEYDILRVNKQGLEYELKFMLKMGGLTDGTE